MAVAAGAVGLPSNDDWVYTHAAGSLFDTGRVDMAGHTTAFVGQLALVQPFLWLSGGQQWAFTAFELVMTSVGIGAPTCLPGASSGSARRSSWSCWSLPSLVSPAPRPRS